MFQTSEWVSIGHPDKVADYISSYILDRYLEKDRETRFAVEVQIKDHFVTLGGEITSKANFSENELSGFVKDAVNAIGYTKEYQNIFGKENTICGDDVVVTQHIGQQSSDIASGVNRNGWGDQGIFWGMATREYLSDYMPADWYLARQIGKYLYDHAYAGIDIKTQVTVNGENIEEVVVAIPVINNIKLGGVYDIVRMFCPKVKKIYVNGTGVYKKHGPIGDCGTTGRKLAVDFYGGNCRIGGGSPWTKDSTKADLTLNLLARKFAVEYIKKHPLQRVVYSALSCRIGSNEVRWMILDECNRELESGIENILPCDIAEEFHLKDPRFEKMCANGLFT